MFLSVCPDFLLAACHYNPLPSSISINNHRGMNGFTILLCLCEQALDEINMPLSR